MGEKEWTPANVLDLFGDRIARATLVIASDQPVAVKDLAEKFDVSNPTIYRRIDPLVEANLLQEYDHISPDGNKFCKYQTAVDEVNISIDEDGYTLDLQIRQDLTEGFEAMLADLGSMNAIEESTNLTTQTKSDDHRGDPT